MKLPKSVIYGMVCPRCWEKKWYYDFHLSGGVICSTCFAETNPQLCPNYRPSNRKKTKRSDPLTERTRHDPILRVLESRKP